MAVVVQERDKTVDILRGLGIILMIMGHIGIGMEKPDAYFSVWYHAFHMPLFYVISGYFFSGRKMKTEKFIVKKAKQLLIPYFFWGMFHIVYNFIECGSIEMFRSSIIESLIVRPTGEGILYAGALWFLPTLFWINAIYMIMNRMIKNKVFLYVAAVVIGVCGMEATTHGIFCPLALDSALVGVPFMAVGDFMKEQKDSRFVKEILHMKWSVFVLLFVLINGMIFYNDEVNFRDGKYGIFMLTFINAVMGTILLWNISRVIEEKLGSNIFHTVSDILALIGRNSVIFVCLNQRAIALTLPSYASILADVVAWQLIARGMTLITVIFECYIVMRVMAGNDKLKVFVGK